MKTLYFECFSGASGNMILGGMIALGVDPEVLKRELSKLDIPKFDLNVSKVDRSGIGAIHVETVYPKENEHRHLSDIRKLIEGSDLDDSVKSRSLSVFSRLAKAEAKVHGTDVESVHFHEVGAMDAIIDVVGACIGLDLLGIERCVAHGINVGSGSVEIDHGTYPVPPPAVAELLNGVPFSNGNMEGELLTPTGAAILVEFCESFESPDSFIADGIGYGAGTREYDRYPNVLRMTVGQIKDSAALEQETLIMLETNIDDCTGELLGHVMTEAISRGALDCWYTPIQMKKGRPATLVSILCKPSEKEILVELIYTETPAIGIRTQNVVRECLKRDLEVVTTSFGEIDVKVARFRGRVVNVKPEFDQVKSGAKNQGIEVKRALAEVNARCAEKYEGASVVGKTATG
ncbi:MAG: nickel pincer cofactor biosynthesis protein LarC [Pyrinomonadaceae bacterium]|nr:nickel pincer cofactor biosynthesis protein LarC [Pyrinomonadaceae bacterium]